MDFLKKNWGLLLYSLGCLVLAVVVGLNIRSAGNLAAAKHKTLDEQLLWFQNVKKENLRLNKENERAAQDNRDRAERKFTELRLAMATKYRIDPRYPATPVEAVRKLQEDLRAINRMLDESDPPVAYSTCPYLSFQIRAASKDLPAMEDVPKIFRQLHIIKEIASIVAQSHLFSLNSIDRPMDLNVIAEDLYTATPISMNVTGTADQVQSFINKMTTEANYLFFLRNLTLITPDRAPNGALSAGPASGTSGAGPGMPGMEGSSMAPGGMGAGMSMGMGMMDPNSSSPNARSSRTPRGRRAAVAAPVASEVARRDGGRTLGAPEEPMWRDQLRAFAPGAPVSVELRFDLIEFNQPEASQQP
jgi:hypothetical protein